MKFRFPCPLGVSVDIDIDIVNFDVPQLLRLRALHQNKLLVHYFSIIMASKQLNWSVNLKDKHGYLYWPMENSEAFYSKAEIERFHCHFFHQSARKIYGVLQRSDLGQATIGLKAVIEEATAACKTFWEFSTNPFGFKASMPYGEIDYNH